MKKNPMHGTGEPSRKNLPDDPAQSERFKDMARELEALERQEKFEQVVKTIVPTSNSSRGPSK